MTEDHLDDRLYVCRFLPIVTSLDPMFLSTVTDTKSDHFREGTSAVPLDEDESAGWKSSVFDVTSYSSGV
jgi:hypothetical protein